jgi:hypothetical protein
MSRRARRPTRRQRWSVLTLSTVAMAVPRELPAGLAVVCDSGGTVPECCRDDLGSGAAGAAGRPFVSLLDGSWS